ncbi:MAG: hypothetical protein ACRBI6_08355 [Acidimicrobiales bacterium]
MQWIGTLGYLAAAIFWAATHITLTLAALILLAWLVVIRYFERRLTPNEGPWNEPAALRLSFIVLPTLSIGLTLFAPLYASWALIP